MKKVDHPKSKRFKEAKEQVKPGKVYSVDEAIEAVKKASTVKFDASVEVHVRTNIDIKKSDQQIRSSASLPHGSGKTIKVAVITIDGDQQKAAKEAGADLVGEADLIDTIKKGKIDFDVLVATPDAMKLLAPVAKILGPKGLMPNPKDGTVTPKVADIVAKLKKGQVNFKNDDSGNVHATIGKISFEDSQLKENLEALIEALKKTKPTALKGDLIKGISISSSMGPGIRVKA